MSLSLEDAVNLCLRAVGLEEIASLDENADLDAASALSTVKAMSFKIQSKGWWFNKEYNWKLTLDGNGEISAPSTALSIYTSADDYLNNDLILRGNKIYDMTNHTYDLTDRVGDGYLVLTFIIKLPWELLPPTAQNYIAYAARRQFSLDYEVDQVRLQANMIEEKAARELMELDNTNNNKTNIYRDNANVRNALTLIGGMNSGIPSYGVFPRRNS